MIIKIKDIIWKEISYREYEMLKATKRAYFYNDFTGNKIYFKEASEISDNKSEDQE